MYTVRPHIKDQMKQSKQRAYIQQSENGTPPRKSIGEPAQRGCSSSLSTCGGRHLGRGRNRGGLEVFVEVLPSFGIGLTLGLCLPDFPLRSDDNDGNGGPTQTILRDAAHPWRTQCGSPALNHTPLASRPDDDRLRPVQCDQSVNIIGHPPRDELDDHGHLKKW